MTIHRLQREQLIRRPLEEVFAFFARPENLEAITPAFLHFRILTPSPIPMEPGALIDYRLKLYGVPVRWRTRIARFEPPGLFTDEQLRGPYASWHHLHEFEAVPEGTLMRDTVDYRVALWPLGVVADALLVKRSLRRIFDHRAEAIERLLAPVSSVPA